MRNLAGGNRGRKGERVEGTEDGAEAHDYVFVLARSVRRGQRQDEPADKTDVEGGEDSLVRHAFHTGERHLCIPDVVVFVACRRLECAPSRKVVDEVLLLFRHWVKKKRTELMTTKFFEVFEVFLQKR